MGCAGSTEDSKTEADTAANRDRRARSALRPQSGKDRSVRRGKYAASDREGSVRSGGLSDAHETLMNSNIDASHLVMSQRSSFRSFGVGGATPSPRQLASGRPPMPPPPNRIAVDRRMSVGRFTDEPSEAEFRARLAAAIAKAKAVHGIDGSVEENDNETERQNAKAGRSILGTLGTMRVEAWVDDVRLAEADSAGVFTPTDDLATSIDIVCETPVLPHTPEASEQQQNLVVMTPRKDALSMSPSGNVLVSSARSNDVDDDDVDAMIFLSNQKGPQVRQRVTQEVLEKNHEQLMKADGETLSRTLYVVFARDRRASA